MKRLNYITLFLLFLFSIINCYGQSIDSISYPVVYNNDSASSNPVLVMPDRLAPELLKENIWIPDEDGGAMPLDIIHIETPTQHKIYVYGKRRIVVFDGDTYNRIATIDISEHSQYFGILINYDELYSSENYFTYNEDDHLLYCTTENLELIAIDTETDSYSVIAQRPDNLLNGYYYTSTFLKYDNLKDRLYWVIEQIISGSNFYVFNASDYSLIHSEEFEDKSIRDIKINNTLSEYYLSIENELRVYNADNYQITNTISNGSHSTGDLLYLNNGGLHKLFCFTYHGGSNSLVHVIDFNNGSSASSFQQPSDIQTSCYYNPNTQFVYVGFEATNDLWVFNPADYSTVANIDTHVDFPGINGGAPLGMTSLSGKMIIGKEHEIVMVDESDNTVESIKQGFNNSFFRTIEANGKAFTIGANVGTVDAIKHDNNEMVLDQTLQIGAEVHLGCYNPVEHKAYFYTDDYIDNSNVYILNTLTNEIKIVAIGSNISDMVYNENDNQVLVSTYTETNQISVIDGVTDQLLPPIQITGQSHHLVSMFLAPNNKLYCMVQRQTSTRIEIFDVANNYTFLSYFPFNKSEIDGEFCYNPTDGNVYATIRELIPNSTFGKLVKIDGATNSFTDYSIGMRPYHIECNPYENKIFVSHLYGSAQNYLTVFDCANSSLSQLTIPGIENVVFDLAYDTHNQFVYALHNILSGDGRISIIQEDVVVSTLRVPLWSISLKYNTNNYNLYVYVPINAAEGNEGELWEFQIFVDENGGISNLSSSVPLVNKHASKLGAGLLNHDMLIDPVLSRLYVANAAFSNISVVDIPEVLVLDGQSNKNYKWLSFPRLERLNNNAVAVQTVLGGERVVPNNYEDQSELQYLEPGTSPQPLRYNFYEDGEWDDGGFLATIKSSLGYKLRLLYNDPYPANNYLKMYGAVLDPSENVVVYADNENWVGYWLYEKQSPFDAIPGNVLDNLTEIKTQDWYCVKEWLPANGILVPTWVCAVHTGDDILLEYADMVVLQSDANNDISFQWQSTGTAAPSVARGNTAYYQYNEQADYTAYIIELDSTQNPQEIAAFIGDSCVGASTVLASDTNVLVPGYIEGMEGEVVFEEYYGSQKSASPPIRSYFVNNNQSGTWEKRTIHTTERKGHYLISFKGRKEESDNNKVFFSHIWPNPASGTLFYDIKTGTDAFVSISVFDIAGKLMARPVNGTMKSGSLTGEFKLTDKAGNKLKPGIYFVKIKAGQMLETKKVIIK